MKNKLTLLAAMLLFITVLRHEVRAQAWVPNGTNLVTFNTNFVGINTNTPAWDLTIHRAGLNSVVTQYTNASTGTGTASGFVTGIFSNGDATIQQNEAGKDVRFFTVFTERMRIQSGGNVAIGTGAPLDRLHVIGNTNLIRTDRLAGATPAPVNTDGLVLSSNVGQLYKKIQLTGNPNQVLLGNGTFGTLAAGNDWLLAGNSIGAADYIGTNNAFAFRMFTSGNEKMRIQPTGNVGINNTTPATKLHLNVTSTNDGIRISQNGNTAAGLYLEQIGGGGSQFALFSSGSGNFQGAGKLLFHDFNGNQTRMTIVGGSGNVGINTTAPADKLHVGGTTSLIRTDVLALWNRKIWGTSQSN